MLLFGFIIAYNVMIAPILFQLWDIPKPELTPDFWDVLHLSIGGYVIGRSGEKILPGVTDSVKKMVVSRRERKAAKRNE